MSYPTRTDIDSITGMLRQVLVNQRSIEERIKKLATQLDLDVQSLTTAMAQDTSDNAALITALGTAIQNSNSDSPADDPAVQAVLSALQTNHTNTLAALQNAGITVPPPSSAAAAVVAKVVTKT